MSLTVFADVVMPASVLSAGVRGKNIRSNARAQSQNGTLKININWARTLRQYQVGIGPMTVSQWEAIEGLFEVTEGGAYGFLLADPKDQVCDIAEGLLYPYTTALAGAIGVGYGVPSMRLYKRYTSAGSARTKDRPITRPFTSPVIKRAGSTVTYGSAAGNVAVDTTTGAATFVADSSSTVTAVTVGATTQVTLTAALAGLAVGNRLYLAGLTGADAALLNAQSHAISNISGGGSNVYTLSTVTTGKTITAAGSGYKYPQASEALTWSGSFYVPVHFMADQIDWELVRGGPVDTRLMSGPTVVLDEVRE